MKKIISIIFLLFICSSCSYRCKDVNEYTGKTVDVPYVDGDVAGHLTNAIVYQLSSSGILEYTNSNGDYTLKVVIQNLDNDKIGFRKDNKVEKNNSNDKEKRKNLISVENRQTIVSKVSLISNVSNEVVWGPHVISADVDYDYVDQDSINDLSFDDGIGRCPILSYSLGQLDSLSSAQNGSLTPLYKNLAQNIMSALLGECAEKYDY